MRRYFLLFPLLLASAVALRGQSPYESSADFAKYAMKLRENALIRIEPKVIVPTSSRLVSGPGRYPWKNNIVTTIFWIGESAGMNNPVHNFSSLWDRDWSQSYGGFDNPDPAFRRGFIPAKFIPRQNPFYIALPYNDVTRGTTKPEAPQFFREGLQYCVRRS